MKNERTYTYAVSHWSHGTVIVAAKDSTQAKRKVCRFWGIKPNDYWCGMSCFTARRLA